MTEINNRAKRRHPSYPIWCDAERRQRASYLATRAHLAPFLVPHRFEGKEGTDPTSLIRSRYGFGFGLNRAWLSELLGHLRSTTATYEWGGLASGNSDGSTERPSSGIAAQMWDDATLDQVSWRNFFEGTVLEWISSSPGGIVLVDSSPGEFRTQAQELAAGKRPYFRFVPMSRICDGGRGDNGWRWLKIVETIDNRQHDDAEDRCHEQRYLIYWLDSAGNSWIERINEKGERVDEPTNLRRFNDARGRAILPIVEANLGVHPDVSYIGSGLLLGLDDIVIDLFNTYSETREAFRDAAFSVLVYRGIDAEKVQRYVSEGSRFVPIGDGEKSELQRLAGDAAEVSAGLELIALGVKAWALSARRKAAEAAEATSQARSGVSLQAEFQLDAKPLLTNVAETLDEIETNAMFLGAQMAGKSYQEAAKLSVRRSTEFRLEEEATRITRLVGEFLRVLPLPPVAKEYLINSWAESSQLFNLDTEVDVEGGKAKLRDALAAGAREIIERAEEEQARRAEAMAAAAGSFGE